MDHGADVGHGKKVRDLIDPGLGVHFNLGKRGGVGAGRSVVLVGILPDTHETLAGESRRRALCHRIDVCGQLVAVVNAAELDGALGRLRKRHPAAAALAVDALAAQFVVLGFPAEILGGNLLQLFDPVGGGSVCRARHRMRGLAAARVAAPRQVLRRIAPGEYHVLPRHPHHLGGHALAVGERFSSEIADSGLDVHLAVGLDDEETVETHRAAAIGADGDAHAADLRAVALYATRDPFGPVELRRALIQRFLDETACHVPALASSVGRPELRLPFRRVQLADRHLIDAELARRFRDDLINERAALHAARLAQRAARRRVRDRGDAAVPERFRLI